MPQVGKKHFAYTAKGKAAAKREAKEKGLKVKYAMGGGAIHKPRGYMRGGNVHKCAVNLGMGAPHNRVIRKKGRKRS